MSGRDVDNDLHLKAEQELARRSIYGSFFHFLLLLACAVVTPIYKEHPAVVLASAALLLAAASTRTICALRILRSTSVENYGRLVLRVCTYASALTWAAFACMALSFYPTGWPGWFVLLMTTGIASGASSSLAPDRRVARTYLLLLLVPVVAWDLWLGQLENYAVSLVVILYLSYLLIHADSQSRHYWKGLRSETSLHEKAFALERSNTYLRALIQESPLPVVVLNPDRKVRQSNPAFERLFGYASADIEGKELDSFIGDPARPGDAEELSHRICTGEALHAEARRLRKDGVALDVEIYGVPLRDGDSIIGIYAIYRDVTQQRADQRALWLADQWRTALLDNANSAIIATDPRGTIQTFNPAAERLLGYSAAELIGSATPAVFHDATETQARAHAFSLELGQHVPVGFETFVVKSRLGLLNDHEWTYVRKDGTRVPVLLSVSALRDPDGNITGFMGMATDISQRRSAEEALRKSLKDLEDLRFALDQHCVVAVSDPDGLIRFANDKFCRLSQYSKAELLGKNHRILNSGYHPKSFFADLWQTITRGQVWHSEVKNRAKDGSEYWVDTTIVPFLDRQGRTQQYISIQTDITARKLAESALQGTKDAAVSASHAKSEFLANMSHEIRTPMNGVIGMTDLLLDTDLDSTQRDYANTIKNSADSLLGVINDVLDFSKIEAGKMDLDPIAFNLRDSLDNALKALAVRAHAKGLELTSRVDLRVPQTVVGDPGRIRQVITNLVSNAVKFTESGEVALGVAVQSEVEGNVCLHFYIRDTGIGIAPDKQTRIFEAFSQADASMTRRFGGTGLGLTISARLVQLMGGTIWVESEPGVGSTFHFTVNVGLADASEAAPPLPDAEALRGHAVLVVDDNATNRSVLRDMLASWGMCPSVAESAEQALRMIRKASAAGQPFGFILTDAQMPGMDGFELASQIKSMRGAAAATIMMLTSAGQRGDAARCRELGISAYLTKPVTQSELRRACLQSLGGSLAEYTQPLVTRHNLRASASPLRILLAEDNMVNRKLALALLEKEGHSVEVAADGRTGLAMALAGDFDLILADVQMPEMSGLEMATRIREYEEIAGGHIPIIAMTAHSMRGDRERCVEAGMDGYVSKPVRKSELHAEIDAVLAVVRNVPPHAAPVQKPDWDSILDRLGGDDALLNDLIQIFCSDTPEAVRELQGAIARQDAGATQALAHKIRGAASVFNDTQVVEISRKIEAHAPQGLWSGLADLARSLDTAMCSLVARLQNPSVHFQKSQEPREGLSASAFSGKGTIQ